MKQFAMMTFLAAFSISGTAFAESDLCDRFAKAYDDANKELAGIEQSVVFDDSAPRETMRQTMMVNQRLKQLITILQAHSHGCTLPKSISSKELYGPSAILCTLVGGEAGQEDKCDRNNWKEIIDE